MNPDGLESVPYSVRSPSQEFVFQPVVTPHCFAKFSSVAIVFPSLDFAVLLMSTDGSVPVARMNNIEERCLPKSTSITYVHPRLLWTLARSNQTPTHFGSNLESLTAKYVKLPAVVFHRMGVPSRHTVFPARDSFTRDQPPNPFLR